jgi:hypothetical protein
MITRTVGALVIGIAAAVGPPNSALAAGGVLQLTPQGLEDGNGTLITIGTAGMASNLADSYKPEKGGDSYYFNIPSERPVESAPGIVFHIPLGNDEQR